MIVNKLTTIYRFFTKGKAEKFITNNKEPYLVYHSDKPVKIIDILGIEKNKKAEYLGLNNSSTSFIFKMNNLEKNE